MTGETKKERIAAAARRALAEAEARRRAAEAAEAAEARADSDQPRPKEIGGRKGPEPTRHGDWEKDGIAYDF